MNLQPLWAVVIAGLFSMVISLVLLRGPREEAARNIEARCLRCVTQPSRLCAGAIVRCVTRPGEMPAAFAIWPGRTLVLTAARSPASRARSCSMTALASAAAAS